MNKKYFIFFGVLIFAGLVYFFKLGALPLLDPDEPRYAQGAWEMLESGDCINPQFNYENRWDKPAFFYWLILWSYLAFGASEWSARFPSAILALLTVMIVLIWSWRNKNRSLGWMSAIILAANVEFSIIGRLSITDMTLCFFQSVALVIAFESWRMNKSQLMIYAYIAAALAFFTKGPVGIVLPMMIFSIFLILTKSIGFLKRARLGSGIIIICFIGLPWFLIEGLIYKDFFQYFFILHNVKRFTADTLQRTEPMYYNLLVIAAGFFPWSIFIPRALWKAFKQYRKEPFYLYLLVWLLMDVAFFSLSRSKLPTYILAAFIPLSLLVGKAWQDLSTIIRSNQFRLEVITLTIISLVALTIGGYYWNNQVPGYLNLYLCFSIPVAISFLFLFALSFLRQSQKVFLTISFCYLIGFTLFLQYLGPKLGEDRSMKLIALEIKANEKEPLRVGSFGMFKPSLVYYLKTPILHLKTIENLQSFLGSSSPVYCVMRKETYEDEYIKSNLPEHVLLQHVMGKVVITNRKERIVPSFEKQLTQS